VDPVQTGLRILAAPLTAAVVVLGIWVAGGAVTNDFELAMRLTGAWLALAGLAAIAVAARSRRFRLPVLGAYAATLLVAGGWLGSSTLRASVVDELGGFEVDNGPDLRVLLVAGPAESEGDVTDRIDPGRLKGSRGEQQYAVPDGVDLGRYATVVVWCRAFSVLFARARLAA
jgi:hypothetical protein